MSIDVSGTSIACYSGCLTSAAVLVTGASPECHDGTILRNFLVFMTVVVAIAVIATLLLHEHRDKALRGEPLSRLNPLTHMRPSDAPDESMHSYTSLASFLRDRSSRAVIILTFVKLLLAVAVSLSLNSWWTFGGDSDDAVVESCSNPTVGHCHSVCGDVQTISVNITDDDYAFSQTVPPTVSTATHYSSASYCVASFRQDCAYKYWLVMKMVPLLFHVAGFLLQFITLRFKRDFNPQQRQYDVIIAHLYPDVCPDTDHGGGMVGGARSYNYAAMLSELLVSPSSSVFVFIEMLTVVYVWGELWFPPIYCGQARPLSLYYYPILMSMLDLTKFNFYVATRLRVRRRFGEALFALLSLELFATNLWISVVLSVGFVVSWMLRLIRALTSVFQAPPGEAAAAAAAAAAATTEGSREVDMKSDFDRMMYAALRNDMGAEHGLREDLVENSSPAVARAPWTGGPGPRSTVDSSYLSFADLDR